VLGVTVLAERLRKARFSGLSEADTSNSGIPVRNGSNIALSPTVPSRANAQNMQIAAVVMANWSNLENVRFL
jgi:hypothetical protein